MKKIALVFALLALGAILAPPHAQATGYPGSGTSLISGVEGGRTVKRLAQKPPAIETFVDLPGPLPPDEGPVGAANAWRPARGVEVVGEGGASGSSPQRADREIRKLIRKLG